MEPFGPFAVGRELDSSHGSTVYKAQKEGDRKGEYVVKLFSLERLASEETEESRSDLDPLFKDVGGSFTSRVNLQKKAADSSPYFAPILAAGHDERGAWYATNFYSRSIKGMLERLVALEARDLFHIAQSLTRAALHLKKTAGRSHGNLKTSNVFIDGTGKPRSSRVVVTDPLPGTAQEVAAYERADLRAIGELIYQLVLHRKVDFSTGWVIVPVEATREWTDLFQKKSSDWLNLCNRLLDSKLSLDSYSLERLESDLAALRPKMPVALVVLPAAAVILLVVGAGTFWFLHKKNYATLVVQADPPGATLVIVPVMDNGIDDKSRSQTNTTPRDGSPLKLSLEKGDYRLRLLHEDLEPSRRIPVTLNAGETITTNLTLAYGTLIILSDPAGARFRISGTNEVLTPYTNRYFKPQQIAVDLDYEANGEIYKPAKVQGTVVPKGTLLLSGRLVPPVAGEKVVEFSSDPPGAAIYLDGNLVFRTFHPVRTNLTEGATYQVRAQLQGWPAKTATLAVPRRGAIPAQNFQFEHGTIDVTGTDPVGMQILVNNQLAGIAPTNIYLPAGRYNLTFRSDGYETNTTTVQVAANGRYPFTPVLKAMAGFIELMSDPPGVEIRDQSDRILGVTGPDGTARLPVPPGVYTLKALFGDLKPLEKKGVEVLAGQPKEVEPFTFDYGTVVFDEVQPADVRTVASIQRGNRAVKPGERIYQNPNDPLTYRIEANGYQPYTTNITVAAKQSRQIGVRLARVTLPIRLISEPPGAEFFFNGAKLDSTGPDHSLPWGAAEFVARHRRLGVVTNQMDIKLEGGNTVPPFTFEYGTVVLTNIPDGVVVKEGNDELVVQPGPMRLAYERPGTHRYDLYEGNSKVDAVTTNLPSGTSIILMSELAASEFRNSVGMALVRIPNLFGPGKEGWVGKSEVSEAEYERVMGREANTSKYKGDDLPVENVTWIDATNFCWKLTQMDTRRPRGPAGRYYLPTLQQWKTFSAGADSKKVSTGPQPSPVGSKGPDALRLNDILGNVREWLAADDPKNKYHIGGGFRPGFGGVAAFVNPQQYQLDQASDDLGFRVIWLPNPPTTE